MTMTHSGWGVRFLDFDNDGWKDLLIAQGHDLDTIQLTFPNLRYREPCCWHGTRATVLKTYRQMLATFFEKLGWDVAWRSGYRQ